jgi:hypothetical protein
MSTPFRSKDIDEPRDPDRIGTVRRNGFSIAISLTHESDDGRIFQLATLPGSGEAVLGEVVCCQGNASALWDEPAAEIRLDEGTLFEAGLIRTVLAIDAAREGTPIDCDEHGLRLDAASRFFLPTVQEVRG